MARTQTVTFEFTAEEHYPNGRVWKRTHTYRNAKWAAFARLVRACGLNPETLPIGVPAERKRYPFAEPHTGVAVVCRTVRIA